MPVPAQSEEVTVQDRRLIVRWKSSRLGEWLAWVYLPAESGLHAEGKGFEARAGSAESAREQVLNQVRRHLDP